MMAKQQKPIKKSWIEKNLKYITIVIFVLFFIKTIQSCNRKMTLNITETEFNEQIDSIQKRCIKTEDSLKSEILARDFVIKDLTTDLKIAGVKVDEAQSRADAVLRTAERIRSNTTIQIKGAEKDTIKNH